ncbi:D-alanyl-D-alanine carboxypeptidase-like protein [Labedaea rhizosphaerae]|uniref:D-alanyl-D-alanine carboxypeptidase-like protein n=2 Tax=Labedaea rhizosphaerae TaxID=598644 RepID=A0A4R6SBK1_LABRH|nr:M15 family metallopeptidase [Labedaea rhizosphaerae]TDP97331.1 D-alanyl-D-alanine carboxypeptidase-like protein [Labedaea rhizosphaerae]
MALVCASAMAACTIPQTDPVALPQTTTTPAVPTTAAPKPTTTAKPKPTTTSKAATKAPVRPVWTVGAHPLPRRADGYGEIQPTPAVLRTRSLPTTDYLPPPSDGRYHATVSAIPAKVLTRSTWQPGCPVAKADLRYLTMSFRGFDGRVHTGEMIVNAAVATKVTTVFGQLFDRRFPIEEMRVTTRAELSAPPTGDGNNTGSFVCRPMVGQTTWSAHAYGLAVDLNPFINPYVNGDLVLPELASSYLDRSWVRPGMVRSGDAVVRAFAAQGFAWGGYWTRPKDLQHFTANGH